MSFDTHCTGCCWRIISSWGGGVHVVGGQCGLIYVSLYLYHWEQIWLISLSSQHLRPDSTDHNHSPFGSPSRYFFFFFCYHNLTHVLAYLYLSFSCFVLRLTLHILTTTLFLTLFHAVMVHFGNTLYMQKELVLGVILPLFPYRVVFACLRVCVCVCMRACVTVCLFVCVYVGRWVCVRDHLQRDQPWGCRGIAAVEGEQRGWRQSSSQ